jgi:cytochrome c-type biogenesis protein CcmE
MSVQPAPPNNRAKFLIAGGLMIAAAFVLVAFSLMDNLMPQVTVEELVSREDLRGKKVRIVGAVIGESVAFQEEPMALSFTVAHLPDGTDEIDDEDTWADVLNEAVTGENSVTVPVVLPNRERPDNLVDRSQAILEGRLEEDGVFHAESLMVQCPSRYEEAGADMLAEGQDG